MHKWYLFLSMICNLATPSDWQDSKGRLCVICRTEPRILLKGTCNCALIARELGRSIMNDNPAIA